MANSDFYFKSLNTELKANGFGRPTLVLDLDRLDQNIALVNQNIPEAKGYRIVAKSLPSVKLLEYIAEKTNTKRLMVFHQPFLSLLVNQFPFYDFLIGKPFPVKALETFHKKINSQNTTVIFEQITWLIDTEARLLQYLAYAKVNQLKLKISIEIDVGLRRGGAQNTSVTKQILDIIQKNPEQLIFDGFMGYEAHIPSAPPVIASFEKARQASLKTYQSHVDLLKNEYPNLWHEQLIFNGAGSKTYMLYQNDELPNDISMGSALVMPTDFDSDLLRDHQPALFIATPVLKKWQGTKLPFLEKVFSFLYKFNSNKQQTLFIYGGKWYAKYEYPKNLNSNALYGYSTNQEIVNCSNDNEIEVDDYVFLRPTQSEYMMLQFGDITIVKNGKIVDQWSVFSQ